METEKLTREIKFVPAFDKRHEDPKKNYGIHCVNAIWCVRGKDNAVTFSLFTGWYLPETQKRIESEHGFMGGGMPPPMPADISHHSATPQYEGEYRREECIWLDDKPCYSDGSALDADNYYDILTRSGGDALWEALEKHYHETFDTKDEKRN